MSKPFRNKNFKQLKLYPFTVPICEDCIMDGKQQRRSTKSSKSTTKSKQYELHGPTGSRKAHKRKHTSITKPTQTTSTDSVFNPLDGNVPKEIRNIPLRYIDTITQYYHLIPKDEQLSNSGSGQSNINYGREPTSHQPDDVLELSETYESYDDLSSSIEDEDQPLEDLDEPPSKKKKLK